MVNPVGNRRDSLLASGKNDPKSPAEKAITSWIHWGHFSRCQQCSSKGEKILHHVLKLHGDSTEWVGKELIPKERSIEKVESMSGGIG